MPAYDELIIVARATDLEDSRYPRFIDALERGVQFLINHPEESWQLFVTKYPELDDQLNSRAWYDTIPRFALRPGALDIRRYRRFAAFLESQALIPRVRPVDHYAVQLH